MLRTLKVPYDAKRVGASAMWHQWLLTMVRRQVLPSKDEASRRGGWCLLEGGLWDSWTQLDAVPSRHKCTVLYLSAATWLQMTRCIGKGLGLSKGVCSSDCRRLSHS